jgi:DNA-binding beta-propeller fold protein YncE
MPSASLKIPPGSNRSANTAAHPALCSTAPIRTIVAFVAIGLVLLAALGGCAKQAGVLFSPDLGVHVWPGPPETARIKYLGSLVSSGDLKPARSPLDSVGDFLFGHEDAQGMVSPIGIATNGAERVFVIDSGLRTVHVFDLDTQKYDAWVTPEEKPGFVLPVAAAFDAARARLIVADAGAAALWCFDAEGKLTETLGKGILTRPCGLAVQPGTGNIFVADVVEHRITVLSPDGAEIGRIGIRGSGPGEFNFPTYVAFDAAGNLFVSDSLNFRVQVFDADRKFVRQIGRKGDLPGYFSQPKGVAVDPWNHLYVVDANFEAFQIFDSNGALLLPIGREGRGPGEFWLPAGVATDPKGRIWVADTYNRRIQVFQYLNPGAQP